MALYLGIDIGGTKIAVCVWSADHQVQKKEVFPAVDYPSASKLVEEIALRFKEDFAAVGVSACGPIDAKQGLIMSPPNLKGWGNEPIVALLQKYFKCPIYLENDANAAALAEWHFGYDEKPDSLLYLTFSTGMGAGLILNRKLWSGHGGGAGEVGFMTLVPGGRPGLNGVPGSFEAYTGGKNLAVHYQFKDFKVLCDGVRAGDEKFKKIFSEWVHYSALGIVNLIYVLDPELIALGTIAVRQGDLFLADLQKQIQDQLISSFKNRTQMAASKVGEQIGDYAALCVALQIGQ